MNHRSRFLWWIYEQERQEKLSVLICDVVAWVITSRKWSRGVVIQTKKDDDINRVMTDNTVASSQWCAWQESLEIAELTGPSDTAVAFTGL